MRLSRVLGIMPVRWFTTNQWYIRYHKIKDIVKILRMLKGRMRYEVGGAIQIKSALSW